MGSISEHYAKTIPPSLVIQSSSEEPSHNLTSFYDSGYGVRCAELLLTTTTMQQQFIEVLERTSMQHQRLGKPVVSDALGTIQEKVRVSCRTGQACAVVFIGTTTNGRIIRSDQISFRMRDAPSVNVVIDMTIPNMYIEAMPWLANPTHRHLETLLAYALGAFVVNGSSEKDLLYKLDSLQKDLVDRLSVPLTTKEPIKSKRLCIVGGGFNREYRKSILAAATHLDLRLIFIDKPGHWLQYQDVPVCEAFLPIDMTADNGLSARILDALSQLGEPIDGITTFADKWLEPTTKVAQKLALRTQTPDALRICTEKHLFRRMSPIASFPSLNLTSSEQFSDNASLFKSTYPIIVKPSNGAASLGVQKAEDEQQAKFLVTKLLQTHTSLVIEKYIDGPEVDVNLVLIDGEVAFFDIVDEPPSGAETNINPQNQSFLEEQVIWPSELPQAEQQMLLRQVETTLKTLGFTEGVFHVECRVIDSQKVWLPVTDNELGATQQELQDSTSRNKSREASSMIIEINPRCVGYPGAIGVEHAHGIDYSALQMLLALGDTTRARLLSHPFTFDDNSIACTVSDWLVASDTGVFSGRDMFDDLERRRPDLTKFVVERLVYFRDGDTVPPPVQGTPRWIALFTVRSELGRKHARRVCVEVKRELRYSIQPQ